MKKSTQINQEIMENIASSYILYNKKIYIKTAPALTKKGIVVRISESESKIV